MNVEGNWGSANCRIMFWVSEASRQVGTLPVSQWVGVYCVSDKLSFLSIESNGLFYTTLNIQVLFDVCSALGGF